MKFRTCYIYLIMMFCNIRCLLHSH